MEQAPDVENQVVNRDVAGGKQFTPWSMWISLAIVLVVWIASFVLYAIYLSTASGPVAFSEPAEFFDSTMPVMIAMCVVMLVCLAFQIVGKENWRAALGMDVFPDAKAWRRALPASVVFVVVFAVFVYAFVDLQVNFFRNFDPGVLSAHLERSLPTPAESSSAPGVKFEPPLPDFKEIEEQMLYMLRFPFENGFASKRFVSYLTIFLLYALINEVIFRGIGYAGYRRTGSSLRAVVIPGVINGLFFFPFGIILALLLGWVRVRGGSLYCSIATSILGVIAVIFVMYMAFVRHML